MARITRLGKVKLDAFFARVWPDPDDLGGFDETALRELVADKKLGKDAKKAPLLAWAFRSGVPDEEMAALIGWLVEQGVDANLVDFRDAPIPVAVASRLDVAEERRIELVRRMIAAGADPSDVPLGPVTKALGLDPSKETVYAMLIELFNGAKLGLPDGAAGEATASRLADLLTRLGDPNGVEPGYGLPLLHKAALIGPWPVTVVLDQGVDVNAPLPSEGLVHVGSATKTGELGPMIWLIARDTPLDVVNRIAGVYEERLPSLASIDAFQHAAGTARHALLLKARAVLTSRGGVENTRASASTVSPSHKAPIDEALLSLAPFASVTADELRARVAATTNEGRLSFMYLVAALDNLRPSLRLAEAMAAIADPLFKMLLLGEEARYQHGVKELGRRDTEGYPDEARNGLAEGILVAHRDDEIWFAQKNDDGTSRIRHATRDSVQTLGETVVAYVRAACALS